MLVECRYHGEVVLEHVEVDLGGVHGAIEGVDEAGVKGAVGQLGDDVREVETCGMSVMLSSTAAGNNLRL